MTIAENDNPGGTFEFNSTTAIVLQVGCSFRIIITKNNKIPSRDACGTQSNPQLTIR